MKIDLTGLQQFVPQEQLAEFQEKAEVANEQLEKGTGTSAEFTGFLKPSCVTESEVQQCKELAEKLRGNSDKVLVIAIGGSYLGARAVSELLDKTDKITFVGNTLSGAYYEKITEELKDKDFSIIVISKSGRSLEPAVALRYFEDLLQKRYGAGAKDRVVTITNPHGGVLRENAMRKGYPMLSIPNDVQGRYSILTNSGLLPLAVAGVNIDALLKGAENISKEDIQSAKQYAAARQALYDSGKKIEVLSVWEPNFRSFGGWHQQLFGESEGKDGTGIFPTCFEYSADLLSMGQYMQQGERMIFETMLYSSPSSDLTIPRVPDDFDGYNLVADRTFDDINKVAIKSTTDAHIKGGVPVIGLDMEELNPMNVGRALKFFMRSCGISGYVQGINPFNQPGVEAYQTNMKEAFESQRASLRANLSRSDSEPIDLNSILPLTS